jgi:hypothetical protein
MKFPEEITPPGPGKLVEKSLGFFVKKKTPAATYIENRPEGAVLFLISGFLGEEG